MPTMTALTTVPGQKQAVALGDALERMNPAPTGVGVFDMEDGSGLWEIGAYFVESPDTTALALLAAAFGAKPFVVSELPDTDWVAHVRRELSPVEAGRFFVHGAHDADKVPLAAEPLLIEAAMAFGTGHHGTTLGCLRALERLIDDGLKPRAVADIGCGTAVLAMAAARVWPAQIIATDIDQVAVEVAEANVKANGLESRVRCHEAAGFDHSALKSAAPFELIFANILKGPLIALAPDISRHNSTEGFAILSGILNEQADDVLAVYQANGYNLIARDSIVDWTTLIVQNKA